MRFFAITFVLLLGLTSVAAQEDELLPPEEAFALTAWLDGDQLIAEYRIAPGYYMYRERFEFIIESSDHPARFSTAAFPTGKVKEDEFFGKTEVYRNAVRVVLPLLFDGTRANQLQVKATSQGCADIGVCYPPLKQALAVDLGSDAKFLPTAWQSPDISDEETIAELQALLNDVTSSTGQQSSIEQSGINTMQSLGDDLGLTNDDEVPHPDKAFMLSARFDKNNVIQTSILLGENIYLYRDQIVISLVEGDGHRLGPIDPPRGKIKNDAFFGETEVIYDEVDVTVPLESSADASKQLILSYRYQGCIEDLICYPPITKHIEVDRGAGIIKVKHDAASNPWDLPTASSAVQTAQVDSPISEQDQYTQFLKDKGFWIIVGLFFIAGLGLTFTPCVFPMIPILSSIIAGQGESITTHKAFFLSLVYVLAMALTYAAAGAIAGYYGSEFNIQIWFQDPWVLSIFAIVFVLLSLSMFGFYELQMPNAIQSRLTAISNSQQGGTLIGVGLMGFFSAIIVGPCVTAPLIGALAFITQTGKVDLGFAALFALGLGMGTPLLLIGTSAGELLPRAGAWMDKVKAFFGVVLLGVAIWLLERILPVGVTMALIAALLIASAIYMGALDSLSDSASGWQRLAKSLGLLILIYGAAYLIGAAAGSKDLVQPLRGLTASLSGSAQSEQHLEFRLVKGQQGLQQALYDAVQQNRNSMLDFYADWCVECKVMEKYTFSHPEVLAALEQVSTLQADVTENDATDTALMSSLGIYGPPAILFFDSEGREIRHRRVVGEMSGEKFAAHVRDTFQ